MYTLCHEITSPVGIAYVYSAIGQIVQKDASFAKANKPKAQDVTSKSFRFWVRTELERLNEEACS